MIILLRGGRVHTAADPDATALAITDGIISWIGSEHAVEMAGRPDQVVHLDGALVAPGFVDAHVHTTDAGLALTGLDLGSASSLPDCLRQIAAGACAVGPHDLLWGHGWDETGWPENRPPTRAEIDAAVGERPTYLSRVDVHSALVSTALAELAVAQPGSSGLELHPFLPQTRAAHHAVRNMAKSLLTPERRAAAQRGFLNSAAAAGIVEVHECAAGDESGRQDLRALLDLAAPISVLGYLAAAIREPEQALALLRETGAVALGGDLSVDGAIGSRTAALHAAYHDDETTCGTRYLSDDDIAEHLWACVVAGVQPGFHAIGGRRGQRGGARIAAGHRAAGRARHRPDGGQRAQDRARRDGRCRIDRDVRGDRHRGHRAADVRRGLGRARRDVRPAAGPGPRRTDEPVRRAGLCRCAAGAQLRRPGDRGLAVGGGAGGRPPPNSRVRPLAARRLHRPYAGRAPRRRPNRRGVGTITVGAPAHLGIYATAELVRPAANPSVARWSTDPRSRVPLLPDLTPGVSLPETLATVVDGRPVYDTGLFS